MKTAMQELIEIVNKRKEEKGSLYGFTFTKKLQKELLEKEKQQIIDAFDSGRENGADAVNDYPNISSYEYYNETFNK